MPLTVSSVERLEEVLEPARQFLSRKRDLFAKPLIVVPNAGTKAWLAATLAAELGARGANDGVVAGIDICYPRALVGLLDPVGREGDDPWSLERLTFAVLSIITRTDDHADLIARYGGPLLAARALAERFDEYHVRRPDMIRWWQEGKAVLSPTAKRPDNPADLPADAKVQYRIWRAVSAEVGEKSLPPPCRSLQPRAGADCDVLVAGLQHLSCQQIRWLEELGNQGDVRVCLVHPSPALHRLWATSAPPRTPSRVPEREDGPRDRDLDPLVPAWLRGARETQWLLASQGIETTPPPDTVRPADGTLLDSLRRTVTHDLAAKPPAFTNDDVSVRIHRCHGLGRQAEVLHDAILHAFRELPDLRPHEVAIMSPCIVEAAPHLEAVFARKIAGADKATMELPLIIADRGIRESSPAAELLTDLLSLIRSRYPVDGMLAVAAHPLVLAHFGIDDDAVAVWDRCLERTKIRWGLDEAQRTTSGLDVPGLRAHTWRLGLEQMLLGAALPDAAPREELGDVVPLDDVAPSQIDAIAALVRIVGVVAELDAESAAARPVGAWCDLLEQALVRLCGAESPDLVEPLRELETLRRVASDIPVPFHDVRTLLGEAFDAPGGSPPLRTGAITATSMVPLRGVPFRVIGVVGYDDHAVSPGEARSDDLVAEQELLGDLDPRLEVRRGLLDCLLACGERLIITCTGMDVATNATRPLVTPLAELVDFARRHGVPDVERDGKRFSAIETFHPRHAVSPGNFVTGGLHPQVAWSHDERARETAANLRLPRKEETVSAGQPATMTTVELSRLEEMLHDPLAPFIRRTLDIDTWRHDDAQPPAMLPLAMQPWEQRKLAEGLIEVVAPRRGDGKAVEDWVTAMQASGRLPFGPFGTSTGGEITTVARGIVDKAAELGMPIDDRPGHEVRLAVGRFQIVGQLRRIYAADAAKKTPGRILLFRPEPLDSKKFHKPKFSAALMLLAAIGEELDVRQACVISQHENWAPGGNAAVSKVRSITADDSIDPAEARRRLEKLCELLELATAAPCGSFGDTASRTVEDPAGGAGREAFEDFVHDPRAYGRSLESTVYGSRPDFDNVFREGGPELEFFQAFAGLVTIVTLNKNRAEYGLQ